MADIQKISGILATLHDLTVETYVPVAESDGTGDFVTKKFDIRNVDNVREYNNKTDFPTVGRAKTLYIDKSNGKIYSWDGNQYLLLSVRIVDGVVSPDSTWSSEKINTTMAQKEHTHTEADITDLKNYALASHSHLASEVTDFNTAVDNNTNVSLNTDARHTHTNKDVLDNTTASYTTAEKNKLADIENQYYNKTESDNKFVNKAGDTVTGDLVVQGDLIISGTTTTIDTEQLKINDNMVTLNSNFTSGTPTQNSGVEILRGDEPTVSMYWNEATDQWELTGGILNATAANADKLDGKDSTEFAEAIHNHTINDITNLQTELDNKSNINHNHDDKYLGKTEKAADSDKLDGNDSTYFATDADLTSHTTDTNNPHNVTAEQLGAANILAQIKTVDGAGSGLDADLLDGINSTDFSRVVGRANATAGSGWITIAENTSGLKYGEIIVTCNNNSSYGFLKILWVRSYANSNFTATVYGDYEKQIIGIRVLTDANSVYGNKRIQIYVNRSANYHVTLLYPCNFIDGYTHHTIVTPIVENTIEGYTVLNEITNLDKVSFATSQGLITPLILSTEKLNTSTSSTVAIDWRTGNLQSLTLTQNTTVTFTSPSAPCNLQLRVIQDATGGRTITLPTLKKANGTTISFTTTPNAVDLLQLYFDGTNYIVTDFIKDIV